MRELQSKLNFCRLLVAAFASLAMGAAFELPANAQPVSGETASDTPSHDTLLPETPHDRAAEADTANLNDAAPESQVEVPVAAVANSTGLEESSLSNEKGHDEFKRPLLFAPDDNGLQPDNPQIKWEMDASGKNINMGGLHLSSNQISIKLDQTKRQGSPIDIRASDKGAPSVINFSFSWPTVLTSAGLVTIESLDKSSTWSLQVTEAMRADWRRKLSRYKSSFLKAHQKSQWGITDLPAAALKSFRNGSPFHVCLSKQNSNIEKLRVCSTPYAFQAVSGGTQALPLKSNQVATVRLKDIAIGKTGLVNTPLGKELALRIDFADGANIEIASQPAALDLLDIVESKDGREIILTGRSNEPLGKKKIIERPAMHFWSASGVAQDTVWQVVIPKEAPLLRILGAFNLPFTFLFRFEKLPTENDRVFIRESATTGAYSDAPVIFGYSPKAGRLESKEISAKKTDDRRFEWVFYAPIMGARNKSRLSVLGTEGDSSSKWVAHHTLYRGYPFEASARLTGVLGSSGGLNILGELSGSAWFETIGFENDLLSRQRWGLAARYFRTLTAIQSSAGVSVSDFATVNFDLKYNVARGIWNRDQIYGLIGSVESITIAGLNANLGGAGLYWARTMPKILADFADKFPPLDYSKYVDVEFIYYPLAASSDILAGQSFNLNFHGKIFWTPRLYGEAGFGIRRYGFSVPNQNAKIEFSTVYGTLGVGIIF